PGEATKYRLSEQPGQCVPTILAGACVGQNITCHRGQARVRRRVRDRPAIRHRKSPPSRETEASNGDRNPAEEDPIPIHPLGSPRPPRSIQDKLLIATSESRKPRRNSARHPANAG